MAAVTLTVLSSVVPRRLIGVVHEWRNELGAVLTGSPANNEMAVKMRPTRTGQKDPGIFTTTWHWNKVFVVECRRETLKPRRQLGWSRQCNTSLQLFYFL